MNAKSSIYAKLIALFHFLILFNNSWAWMSFATVGYAAADFYNLSLDGVNLLSSLFMFITCPVTCFALHFVKRHHLLTSLLMSAVICLLGSILRVFSVLSLGHVGRHVLLYMGQSIMALSMPLCLVTPAKTAATFFPVNQRLLVNTFITMATLSGLVIASLVSPQLFIDSSGHLMVSEMLLIQCCFCGLTAVLGTVMMMARKSISEEESGENDHEEETSVVEDLKKLSRDHNIIVLLIVVASGYGLITAIATIQEQLLCVVGYSNRIAGLSVAVTTASGLVGAFLMGLYCSKTHQLSTAIKAAFFLVNCGIIVFIALYGLYIGWWILLICFGFGFPAIGILPLGIELIIEGTFPIGVTTVTGTVQLFGNLSGALLIYLLPALSKPLTMEEERSLGSVCNLNTHKGHRYNPSRDYTYSLCGIVIFVTLLTGCLIFTFKPSYKRRDHEKRLNEHPSIEVCDENGV